MFKIREKTAGQTDDNGTKRVEIMVPHLSSSWKTLEMSSINWETNLDLDYSENCVRVATNVAAQAPTF